MRKVEKNLINTIAEIKADIAAHTTNNKIQEGYEYLEDMLSGAEYDLRVDDTEYEVMVYEFATEEAAQDFLDGKFSGDGVSVQFGDTEIFVLNVGNSQFITLGSDNFVVVIDMKLFLLHYFPQILT